MSDKSLFTFHGADPRLPVVPRGPSDRWDGKYVNPGGVLYHDEKFHMFRNGFKDWPGLVSVGYMTSTDGYIWTPGQEEPVFASDQVPGLRAGQGADVSSVVVEDDGTWVMFYHTVGNNPTAIGRATAPAPTGPWTPDTESVLKPGKPPTWDHQGLAWPSVVHTAEGYVMYYAGKGLRQTSIGRATSPDGVTWTKHDDPDTTDKEFAESDPVFVYEAAWEGKAVDRPRAQLTPEGWVMLYQAGTLSNRGLAFSDDGIHWTRHADNPIITAEDFPIEGSTWDTALLYQDGVYFYYMEIGSLAATNIYLATHPGPLRPAP